MCAHSSCDVAVGNTLTQAHSHTYSINYGFSNQIGINDRIKITSYIFVCVSIDGFFCLQMYFISLSFFVYTAPSKPLWSY